MPNKIRRNSVVEMLSKVPVNRGSLIKSIENLLKTIESSESAVMIPTLLRDKCDFDAWELIFVAKILKASILGHTDLVEFYMNHMRQLISQQQQQQQATGEASAMQSPSTPTTPTRQPAAVSSASSASSASEASNGSATLADETSLSLSTSSSVCSTASSGANSSGKQTKSQTSSSVWVSASSCLASSLSSSSIASACDAAETASSGFASSSSATSASLVTSGRPLGDQPEAMRELQSQLQGLSASVGHDTLPSAADTNGKPALASQQRQAQPPSLLQLTTTNNHMNSIAQVSLSTNDIDVILAQQSASTNATAFNLAGSLGATNTPTSPDGALSISTGNALAPAGTAASTPVSELRTSRSAGCLFKANSCASSPRTPNTAHSGGPPMVEGGPAGNGALSDDPSAPVKLLLQIEQLKSSIVSVTNQLESVVELYKKSIDNIAA